MYRGCRDSNKNQGIDLRVSRYSAGMAGYMKGVEVTQKNAKRKGKDANFSKGNKIQGRAP